MGLSESSSQAFRIGVDVGGTNTDAVLLRGRHVAATIKSPTTDDIRTGVLTSIRQLLTMARTEPTEIKSVSIGTTQFTNAFVEGRSLTQVAALRLGYPSTVSLPPFVGWPEALRETIRGLTFIASGGYEFDGQVITPIAPQEIREIAARIRHQGIKAIAVSSVFSPLNPDMEQEAAAILAEEIPDARTTCSADLGRVGLLERENAAIMNAALSNLAPRIVKSFKAALEGLDIRAPLYISQNDGTLLKGSHVEKYPVLTFASGPTNSMRGAAFLTGKSDIIVVDIGGTTTDIGVITNGFPRESAIAVDIGGVRTNFRMPDILALGLGGGSIVQSDPEIRIGPRSVGYELTSKAMVFGGDTLTMTDIAVAHGSAKIGDPARVSHLDPNFVGSVMERARSMVEEGINRMKTSSSPTPVVLVGGGSIILSGALSGASEILVPEKAGVANAIGAALANVSGEVDRVVSYGRLGRGKTIARLKLEAIAKAVAAGAIRESVAICDIEEVPLAYLPGENVRIKIKAVGELES